MDELTLRVLKDDENFKRYLLILAINRLLCAMEELNDTTKR